VVGDRIEISSVGGSKFVVGVVERVDPMRTIIRTDSCMPITIPNKVGTISSENAYHHLDRLLPITIPDKVGTISYQKKLARNCSGTCQEVLFSSQDTGMQFS